MSLWDFVARLTGRGTTRSGVPTRTRSRSDQTVRLPVAARPGTVKAPQHALPHVDRESATSATPPPVAAAPSRSQAAAPRAPSEPAPAEGSEKISTEIPEARPLAREEVVGVLVAIDGELKGDVHRLYDGENRLGRADSGEVVLASKWISREHAMLVHHGGIFAIVALNERNATFVNGEETEGTEVGDGDTIRLGRTTFRFKTIEGM